MTRLIGLTGKSGAGKGAVCSIFKKHGFPVIDADRVYHEMLQESNACTSELISAFGCGIAAENGGVDRKALSRAVFASEDVQSALHTLNGITHKYIMANVKELLLEYGKKGASAVVFDAPQLFEAGADRLCDVVLGIIAEDDVCVQRIIERDGIDEQTARRRLAAQHDNAFFKERCDAVIENNYRDIQPLSLEVCRFIETLGV